MAGKVVGILGGMGPEATVSLFDRIVSLTPAERDQDHLQVIVNNDPRIADRTESILRSDNAIVTQLVEAAKVLERAGADFIAMPCNTAHHWYAGLAGAVEIPVINMVEEVGRVVGNTLPGGAKVGILATTGTLVSQVYQAMLEANGFGVTCLPGALQAGVMQAVLNIKSNGRAAREEARQTLLRAGSALQESGAEGLVLGCTEIPLVVGQADFSIPVFDSLQILAEKTLECANS